MMSGLCQVIKCQLVYISKNIKRLLNLVKSTRHNIVLCIMPEIMNTGLVSHFVFTMNVGPHAKYLLDIVYHVIAKAVSCASDEER